MPLSDVLDKINNDLGIGVVQPYTEFRYPDVETIPTGSLSLDLAIGGGKKFLGVPVGAVTALWGPKGGGKSTLCNHIMANAQRMGKTVALVDMEFSFDHNYAAACGVNLDRLLFVRCVRNTGEVLSAEEAWEIIDRLIRSGEVGLIIIDSLDAMVHRAEIDGEYGESHVGRKARLNAQAMRKLAGPLKGKDVALIATKQRRYKIGVIFGSPETMGGGEQFQHSLSLRIDIRPSSDREKKDKIDIGSMSRCLIPWNKIGPPRSRSEFLIRWGEGIVKENELLDLAVEFGALTKKGAYYYFTEGEFVQGKIKAIDYLVDHPDYAVALEKKVREAVNGPSGKALEANHEEGARPEPEDGGDPAGVQADISVTD